MLYELLELLLLLVLATILGPFPPNFTRTKFPPMFARVPVLDALAMKDATSEFDASVLPEYAAMIPEAKRRRSASVAGRAPEE